MQEFVNLCDENSFLLKNFPVQSTRLPGAELNESKLRTKDGSSMHGTFGLQTSAVTLKKESVGINRLLFFNLARMENHASSESGCKSLYQMI